MTVVVTAAPITSQTACQRFFGSRRNISLQMPPVHCICSYFTTDASRLWHLRKLALGRDILASGGATICDQIGLGLPSHTMLPQECCIVTHPVSCCLAASSSFSSSFQTSGSCTATHAASIQGGPTTEHTNSTAQQPSSKAECSPAMHRQHSTAQRKLCRSSPAQQSIHNEIATTWQGTSSGKSCKPPVSTPGCHLSCMHIHLQLSF